MYNYFTNHKNYKTLKFQQKKILNYSDYLLGYVI